MRGNKLNSVSAELVGDCMKAKMFTFGEEEEICSYKLVGSGQWAVGTHICEREVIR